ncbi:MAG: apolipoprotein N-acyltransferase [Thiothrix sp.]|uniref:apolipoprotein N-acyltransferase n=1 Tax=Thiothrix sp. TaxID=1032 RepID=UPI00263884A3|nr:apolipoprotein N-acyltransferase [Thiothrix sp.]MDD5391489.1 apolipoprotein N-acyltransferase [Thiothrix sp.]
MKHWLLAGLLYGLAFPSWEGVELAPLAWISLIPLLLPRSVRLPFWRYFYTALLFGVFGSLIAGHWTLGNSWSLGLLAVAWHGLIVALPLWLFRWQVSKQGYTAGLFTLPFCWTAWEWFAANNQPFFWGALGATQSNQTWLVQFVDLTGVWGISFWIVALNAALAYQLAINKYWAKSSVLTTIAATLCAFLFPPVLYAQWYIHAPTPRVKAELRLVLLEPDAQQQAGEKAIYALMDTLDKRQLDMVVWPESIFPNMPFHNPDFADNIRRWDTPILISFIGNQPNMSRPGFDDQYAAAMMMDNATITRIMEGPVLTLLEPHYRKQRLVPHTELQLIPDALLRLFPTLEQYLPARMQYAKQSSPPLHLSTRTGQALTVSPLICYEAVFPHLAANAAHDGADALFILANDIHFGATESWQAASFARLRAIETRRPVVRTSTSGVVGVIDYLGNWQMRDNSRQAGAYSVTVALTDTAPSVYGRWIDIFPKLCAMITLLSFLMNHASRHWRVSMYANITHR